MKFSIFLVALILSTTLVSRADFIEAEIAFEDHRYNEAIRGFEKEIQKNGDYRAKFYLGKIYLDGLGVAPDTEKALGYLNESANQNYDPAQALLGYLYEEGRVVPQDKRKAISLYKKAAEQNNSSAKFNLGLAYYKGEAVPQDANQAVSLLNEVDIQEIPQVGRYLGDIYISQNDAINAAKAYKKSAIQGDIDAFYALGNIYLQGGQVPKAIEYYTYAASMGNIPAQYVLGTLYINGKVVERDIVLGHAWLKMAADQGYTPALDTKNQVEADLSRSEVEKARKEFLRLKNDVVGKVESPFVEEERIKKERIAKEKADGGKKIRRRR